MPPCSGHMSGLSASGARKKPRAGLENEDGGVAETLNEKDLHGLRIYLQREEVALRAEAKQTLNHELIDLIEACKNLVEKTVAQESFSAALKAGVVKQVREQLRACYRLGVRLESWLITYQPPLSAGGNVGVSAEVQEGIYQNVHTMTVGSSDALHRMLAFEREHAQMRTKCTDEAVSLPSSPSPVGKRAAMRRCGARCPGLPQPLHRRRSRVLPHALPPLSRPLRYGSVTRRCVLMPRRFPSKPHIHLPTRVPGKRFSTRGVPHWLASSRAASSYRCFPGAILCLPQLRGGRELRWFQAASELRTVSELWRLVD